MKTINEFANFIGFGSAKGMIVYFLFLVIITFIGLMIYYGQKPTKKANQRNN